MKFFIDVTKIFNKKDKFNTYIYNNLVCGSEILKPTERYKKRVKSTEIDSLKHSASA